MMDNNKYIHARTCVYNMNYHIVWTVKYRRKILSAAIEFRLNEILIAIAKDKGFEVKAFSVGELDHVHIFISAPPRLSVSYIVKMLKGISGRHLFLEFPEIKDKLCNGQLWNGSYFVETIGSTSADNIKEYIERQKIVQR
ncbi:MAG TPA: IS200/IS605 family transposase [Clostridia bacterium]|nr:IS200/IS605 family transposase [Clostridia bacterium]